MEKKRRASSSSNPKETASVSRTTFREFGFRNMENITSSGEILKNFSSNSIWATEAQDYLNSAYSYYSYLRSGNESDFYYSNISSTTTSVDKKVSCQWEPAQHSLFQISNMCFLSAFVIPKNYRSGILAFRWVAFFFKYFLSTKNEICHEYEIEAPSITL